jgi:hypothetical protein
MTTTGIPTPNPIFAPVDRPLKDGDGVLVAEGDGVAEGDAVADIGVDPVLD